MILFSRAFIRKRVISLATTAAVSATSFAFAKDPPEMHHVRSAMENAAMNNVMANMTIKPSSVDRDFVAMMVPRHQGMQTQLR